MPKVIHTHTPKQLEAWERKARAGTLFPTVKALTHGTLTGYTGRRCRCAQCRAAAAEYRRAYRARMSNEKAGVVPPARVSR